ncbi:class I SAM-dependent methyltransferase [Ramlibacter sp. PS4R-6]|uniref:class I SAM-dependent methyltransferase n=1 Tax=Ramlibacter sp. PS4R-6 TaxID=3133438 RepID=UPI00309C6741
MNIDRVDGLACPVHHGTLRHAGGILQCAECGPVGRMEGAVFSFLPQADAFYEGRYSNRTRFLPRNDGLVATFPLRVVLQGYPTTVAAEVPEGSTVVEIGCAGGLAWFARRYRMAGIDLSLGSLRLAADYRYAVQGDARRLPFPDGSVDGVVSSCFFEHLDDEGKLQVLRECARVLRPGGKVVFFYDVWTDNPVIAFFRRRDPARYRREFLEGDGHVGYASLAHNAVLFERSGLAVLRHAYHERTPLLSNSCWQKLATWPGLAGRLARLMDRLTGGVLRLPALVLVFLLDTTVGRLLPADWARCVTTVARKP